MDERRKELPGKVAPLCARWVLPKHLPAMLRANPPIVYQLLIRLDQPVPIRIASLGSFTLPPGWYVYSGSARRTSGSRLARHLRKRKPRRWHIDYLLSRKNARVVGIRLWPWQPGLECAVNQALLHATGPCSDDSPDRAPWFLRFAQDRLCGRGAVAVDQRHALLPEMRSYSCTSTDWAVPPILGFGSSDCRHACPAHLLFLPGPPPGITDV
jgi:Uri superfamily endonuclease